MSATRHAEPLLHRIEALPESGAYALTFALPNGGSSTVTVRVVDDRIGAPEANMIPGWPVDSPSFVAALAAVAATEKARRSVLATAPGLQDVPGGWDVALGNVVLSPGGRPACVVHGDMIGVGRQVYHCEGCEARAVLSAN